MGIDPSGSVLRTSHGVLSTALFCGILAAFSAVRPPCGENCDRGRTADAQSFLQLQTSSEKVVKIEENEKAADLHRKPEKPSITPRLWEGGIEEGKKTSIHAKRSGKHVGDLPSVLPFAWSAVGPIASVEDFTDPLTAFGGIQAIAERAPAALLTIIKEKSEAYHQYRHKGLDHTGATKALSKHNISQPNRKQQALLESFPAEFGPAGRTVWALAFVNDSDQSVSVNFTEAALQAGGPDSYVVEPLPSSGWAFGDFELHEETTALIQCSSYFMMDGIPVIWTPDAYDDGRAVQVFHLAAGKHRMYVRFQAPTFSCDMFKDSTASRENITGVAHQSSPESPLMLLSDHVISDVVDGHFPSPHVGIPVLNVAKESVVVKSAKLLDAPKGLHVELDNSSVPISAGQNFIVRLALRQTAKLHCHKNLLNLTVLLHPQELGGQARPASKAHLAADCRWTRVGGYRVTFPDFDNSIQHMWVAPPDTRKLKGKACPSNGCPIMLSLHGADVVVGPIWGHSYALNQNRKGQKEGFPFPYPAWLVQPSNRYHWGTDWQSQGYDNALAALDYVAKNKPGLLDAAESHKLRPDLDRLLVTGHSMGGHGCMVFSTHEPDRLLGSACGAGWTSLRRVTAHADSPLRDYKLNGIFQSRMSEHDADFLSSNMRGVPLKMVYGEDDDNVNPKESKYMQELVDSFSGDAHKVAVSELPHTPHWFGQNVPELVSFFKSHLQEPQDASDYILPTLPETFEFVVASPSSFGTKGNLKLLQLGDSSKPGRFFVRRCVRDVPTLDGSCGKDEDAALLAATATTTDAVWYIETYNVRRFRFSEKLVRGRPLPKSVVLDGTVFNQSHFDGSLSPHAHFCLGSPASQGAKPRWGVCEAGGWSLLQRGGPGPTSDGPLVNILRRAPVCIIHGKEDAHKRTATYLANKLYFVSRYSVPIIEASDKHTSSDQLPGDCSNANLIIIGHASKNPFMTANRCVFPYVQFHKSGTGFTLGGMSYTGDAVGLLALGRLRNGRLAVLLHGTDALGLSRVAARVPVGSSVDSTDFMVVGPDAGWEGLGGVLAAGYLDNLWRPSATGSWAEPEHSVKRWRGEGFDETDDGQCEKERHELELSDLELQSFARSGAQQSGLGWLHLTFLVTVAALFQRI